jgi:transforming growth factor-beta-induced protein
MIMKKQRFILGMAAILAVTLFTACEKEDDNETTKAVADMTIAEYAVSDPNFSTLVKALSKANLVGALSAEGTFTVFAPTNAAFDALFKDLGISGVEQLTAEQLTPILLYHVLGSEVKSSMIAEGYVATLSPAQSSYMNINISLKGGVKLNKNTSVTAADVDVKNGVIHVIDKVLLPPTVVDHALANDNFSILVAAVVKAGLVETLMGNGPFTIFAPTNTAFEALFTQLGINGINDLTADQLIPILKYHVVSGNVRSSGLTAGSVPTLNGNINVTLSPKPAINTTTMIIATDVQASNGVIHVIDKVLLP